MVYYDNQSTLVKVKSYKYYTHVFNLHSVLHIVCTKDYLSNWDECLQFSILRLKK